MTGKEKRIVPKWKTLLCPNWPLYLEATLGVRGAHPHCGPFAFKCRILQPLWQPQYMGGQRGHAQSGHKEICCSRRGRMTSAPAWQCCAAGTPPTHAANPNSPECNQ